MALSTADLNQIKKLMSGLATKADLQQFATKADLQQFATKADLERFATKSDLERFATKDDLNRMEARLTTSIGLLERDTFTRLDDLELRVTRLEKGRTPA